VPLVRVPPFRGDQVASGVVVLTALVALLQLRMGWAVGVHLGVAGAATAGVGLLVAGCPRESRPYVSAIIVCGLLLVAIVLGRLGQVLGADAFLLEPGTATWALAVFGVLAAGLAKAYDTAAATLVAGLALAFVPALFAEWLGDPSGGVVRTLLLVCAVVLVLGAVARRDRRPTHAAQLANAAGLALVAIGAGGPAELASLASFKTVFFDASSGGGPAEASITSVWFLAPSLDWGWQVALLLGGFGLLAYGAVDRQRGPVLIGLLVIVCFLTTAATGDDGFGAGSLLGWPIVLAVAAGFMLVVGLRPTTPVPPDPDDAAAPPPPPLPLR
jgi:hypothetical protein